jgi:Cupredoxin-like domain
MLRRDVLVGALILSVVAGGTPARSADPPETPLTIENHRFTPEITVTAGTSFVLVITNKDATPEEFESGQDPPPADARAQEGDVQLHRRFQPKHGQGQDHRGVTPMGA